MTSLAPRPSARTRLAVAAGRLTSAASRATGRGSGTVVGGRVTLALAPHALADLSRGRPVALVSATNGKTTTTRMLARALATLGPVASNTAGSNMPAGLTAAAADPGRLVLEVDEPHLPEVMAATTPSVIVALNLSRDQLDRVAEVRRTAARWRDALTTSDATIIANCDDPLVVCAARGARKVTWVACGGRWHEDATLCPECARLLTYDADGYRCDCGFARPQPTWQLGDDTALTPAGPVPLRLQLPGEVNRGNALAALAAAVTLGANAEAAARSIASLTDIEGRYAQVRLSGRAARLLLAKNPAGWAEALTMIADDGRPVIVAINARIADGRDPSWLWDVPFERLAGRTVIAIGERRYDLAVRLQTADVDTHVADTIEAAIAAAPGTGPVDVAANYTAFQDIRGAARDDR